MTRTLVPLRQIIDDIEAQGGDADTLYADPDDIAEFQEDTEPED